MARFLLPLLCLLLTGCTAVAAGPTAAGPKVHASPTAARPAPPPKPQSWLSNATLLTIYGRGFGTAPILGRLGFDNNMQDVSRQAVPFMQGISGQTHTPVRLALHLIYGMATPCDEARNCLNYLDDTGVNIVRQYIEPAARHGWLVILDDQLGSSTPAAEMARIIARGYLRFDNVGVALDPEFRSAPGQGVPGIPVGSVTAAELNAAEVELSRYARTHVTPHRKILLIHQFQYDMIQERGSLRLHLPLVDPVIVMDGFGDPGTKAEVYHDLLSKQNAPRIRYRGIKLFYPNPYEQAGHLDDPLMTWAQVFGRAPAGPVGGPDYWVSPAPQVVVIA